MQSIFFTRCKALGFHKSCFTRYLRNPDIGESSVVAYPVTDLERMKRLHGQALNHELRCDEQNMLLLIPLSGTVAKITLFRNFVPVRIPEFHQCWLKHQNKKYVELPPSSY